MDGEQLIRGYCCCCSTDDNDKHFIIIASLLREGERENEKHETRTTTSLRWSHILVSVVSVCVAYLYWSALFPSVLYSPRSCPSLPRNVSMSAIRALGGCVRLPWTLPRLLPCCMSSPSSSPCRPFAFSSILFVCIALLCSLARFHLCVLSFFAFHYSSPSGRKSNAAGCVCLFWTCDSKHFQLLLFEKHYWNLHMDFGYMFFTMPKAPATFSS